MEDHHIMIVSAEFDKKRVLLDREDPAEGLAQQIEIHAERWGWHDLNGVASAQRRARQPISMFKKLEFVLSANGARRVADHGQCRKIVVPKVDINEVRRYCSLLADNDLEGFGALPCRDHCRNRAEYADRFAAQRRRGRLRDIG